MRRSTIRVPGTVPSIAARRRPAAAVAVCLAFSLLAGAPDALAEEVGRGEVYSVVEIGFKGPQQDRTSVPSRDVDFWIRVKHESGAPEYKIHGFFDGNARGDFSGNLFKVRFAPTKAGRWDIVEVHSNSPVIGKQHQGNHITAVPSNRKGFWLVDEESRGRRWYKRSDGSHPYILGNTQYSFLSGYKANEEPSNVDIAKDVARNAEYFSKLRFTVHGDRYVHPTEKPFLDDDGHPTDSGDYSHRQSARWFLERADVAVKAAFEKDMIADLILCGPDTEDSRATMRAGRNNNDPTPFLKYMAARYGSYPNVWFCLCNEYDIKKPRYTEEEIAKFGKILRSFLPYESTPVSNHSASKILWHPNFDKTEPWYDHHIIQRKIRSVTVAADVMQEAFVNPETKAPRNKPTIDDELSYQGEGDKHSREDSIEAFVGIFLGGGYGTAGYKPGNKLGHYFWGTFDPAEHTAAVNLKFLRETIDGNISFWEMTPGADIFSNLDAGARAMSWSGHEYVLGTNKAHKAMTAKLPAGRWTVKQFDIVAMKASTLSANASGQFRFDAPDSRAVLFHFKKN